MTKRKRYYLMKGCGIFWWVVDRETDNVVAEFSARKARHYAREHAARLNKEVKRAKS